MNKILKNLINQPHFYIFKFLRFYFLPMVSFSILLTISTDLLTDKLTFIFFYAFFSIILIFLIILYRIRIEGFTIFNANV